MKTALRGLTAMLPDYAMVCFSCAPADRAASGERPVPEEVVTHLAAAAGLGVPVFGVLTKVPPSPVPRLPSPPFRAVAERAFGARLREAFTARWGKAAEGRCGPLDEASWINRALNRRLRRFGAAERDGPGGVVGGGAQPECAGGWEDEARQWWGVRAISIP
mmetsp:Transcript_7701/g.18437  ORF Transcript_7701/g.18437 Transcript_7701/m.18437 type:complete len:162 (+) Transcript_7701:434-919(+)